MKSVLIILSLLIVPAFASAEEKTCTVKGMHCESCVDMVKDKVCNDQFEVCDVTVMDVKDKKGKATDQKIGSLHLKTKDTKGKIDEKAIATAIADTEYKVEKCKAGAAAKTM